MGCRTAPDTRSARPSGTDAIRPIVLLAVAADDVRVRWAYQLLASGFDVVMNITNPLDICRPDVIVTELIAAPPGSTTSPISHLANNARLRGVPVIAVAGDVGDHTRRLARQDGCAAVCLITCSGSALVSGIHAVLDHRER